MPVLADCRSLDDWNLDPASVEARVTPRTQAVIAVHYAGFPCAMDALGELSIALTGSDPGALTRSIPSM